MSEGIIPTLAELVALRAAAQGRRPPRRGRHGVSGQASSPLRGRGMEYAESREYAHGDDARHIDWRLTARSGQPHRTEERRGGQEGVSTWRSRWPSYH